MKKIVFLIIFSLIGCSSKIETKQEKETTPVVTAKVVTPKEYVAPPDPIKGHYKNFGFCGSDFVEMTPGQIRGGEGGVITLYTKDEEMWSIDTEPNDTRVPLEIRKIYLARISDEVSPKRCGVWLREFTSVPTKCIEEEKIVSWDATKKFMLANLSASEQKQVAEVEKFLRERSISNN